MRADRSESGGLQHHVSSRNGCAGQHDPDSADIPELRLDPVERRGLVGEGPGRRERSLERNVDDLTEGIRVERTDRGIRCQQQYRRNESLDCSEAEQFASHSEGGAVVRGLNRIA